MNSLTGLTLEMHLLDERLLFSSAAKHYYNQVERYNTNIYLQNEPEKVKNIVNTFGYNAGLRYNFSSTVMVKTSYERAVRLPLSAELFGDGALITPAILLKPEKASNITGGIIYDKIDVRQRRLPGNISIEMSTAETNKINSGVLNVMRTLHVLPGTVEAPNAPLEITKRAFINSEHTGIFYSDCKSGQLIRKGMKLGYITDLTGNLLSIIYSAVEGYIIYQIATPPVNKGEILFSLGISQP